MITDGKSRLTDETKNEAHLCRDDGIVLTSVGIKSADYQELFDIAGDASRVYNVSDFDKLAEIVTGIEKTTCTGIYGSLKIGIFFGLFFLDYFFWTIFFRLFFWTIFFGLFFLDFCFRLFFLDFF